MSYVDSVNRAIEYIEENLKSPVQIEDIAAVAFYSKYHFQRLFSLMVGETVGSYLRKRRLTEAARELVDTERSIIDIALDYQFQSQESFGRSFKTQFEITPHQYRKEGNANAHRKAHSLTPIAVSFLNNRISKEPEFVTREKIPLLGFSYFGQNQQEIQEIWASLEQRIGLISELLEPGRMYGMVCYDEQFLKSRDFGYLAAGELKKEAFTSLGDIPFEFTLRVLPAATYAVFTQKGVFNQIPVAYEYIYGKWFSQSDFEPIAPFDFEYYEEPYDPQNADNFEFKIFIPVKLLP